MLTHNHLHVEEYGLTFFKTALKQIQERDKQKMINISVALRMAQFAKDEDFNEFIGANKEEVISDDTLLNF